MRMKRMSALLLVAGLSLTAMACGKQDGEGDKKGAVDEPINLVFFTDTGMPEQEFEERIGSKVKKKFPHITPVYNKVGKGFTMEELVAAGSAIDVVWSEDFGKLKEMNMQFDMSELVAKHKFDLKAFDSDVVNVAKQFSDGKLYGVPGSFVEGFLMFYNKDLFNKFGVAYPKDGITWDEANELNKRLTRTDGGVQYLGLASNFLVLARNQLSIPLIDAQTEQPTFLSNNNWAKIVTDIYLTPANAAGFSEKMKSLNNAYPGIARFYREKDIAMYNYMSHFPVSQDPTALASFNWDMAALPTFKEKPGVGAQMISFFWSITSTSKHKDASMQVIKFLSSEEFWLDEARAGSLTPLTTTKIKEEMGKTSKFPDKNWKAMFHNKSAPTASKSKFDVVSRDRLWAQTRAVMFNNVDLNTAIRKAQEDTVAEIKKQTGK